MSLLTLPEPDAGVLRRRGEILRHLAKLVPEAVLIADKEGRSTFETDALTAYRCLPLAVVLPRSTEEVAKLLRFCRDRKIKVVPRGAGTSLCGGALPLEDSIVIGLSRMNRVLSISTTNRTARVEAGITNLAISTPAAPLGFFYAPDPSSQLACTLGGNIATNAGGAHCLKYGVTTNHILALRVVTIDGDVIDIGGDHLDAPGYDFLGLITGSEGQFCIVTEATVRLTALPESSRPMLIGFGSAAAAGSCVAGITAAGVIPVAIEFMDKPAIEVCENFAHAGYPLDVEALLIVEVSGSEDEVESQIESITDIAESFDPLVLRASRSPEESVAIWKGRKAAFGAIGQISDYYCMDGVIPLARLSEALVEIGEICKRYRFRVANIFHAGDGNLHPLILYDSKDPGDIDRAERCGAEILKMCVNLGGCLTGEHGVGLEKRELMGLQFSAADLGQQMRVKSAFDPNWFLNPGKVFPLEGRETP